MNQTKVRIESLLKISHDVTFDEQNIKGYACLKTEEDLALLNEFNDGLIADLSCKLEVYRFNIGDEVNYTLSLYHTGQQFASYENFILHQMNFTNNTILSDEYVIYEEKYKVDHGEKAISNILKLFSDFIKILSEKYFYRDNQIVLFSKTHCEISVQPRYYEKYLDLAKVYNDLSLDQSLKNFIDWLSIESSSNDQGLTNALEVHKSERYSIAASEFVDHLITFEKNERVFSLLKNIDTIYQSTLSKYSLYLEDFKYSKFTDKITKHSEEFLNRVNKVISDLQSQILAIPLAISLITVFKENEKVNVYIYAGFLIYLIMVFYACCQQAYNLIHIKAQINQFNEYANLPKDLSPEWKKEIKPVKTKIFWHESYLVLVALFIGFLIGICIINIPYLYEIILFLISLKTFSFVLVFYSF
ncbi:hypothetical protein LXC30_003998, partial [Acinetobacter baumannii]|nr:hypothetical protein [Acinetobacter baumannii]